ncbi:MAG: type II secretion system F family protein [Actinomycetota bacterium]
MIAQHLQIPTLILIAPLLVWGIWLLSESSFDTWGTWMKPIRKSKVIRATTTPRGNNSNSKSFKETPQIRDLRSRSIFLNFAIGFSLVLLSYFFIFINPDFLAPVLSAVATISLYLAYAHREPERIRAREKSDFEGELPTYMQLMTVLISAGISPARAMDHLSRRSNSISGEKLRKVVVEIQNGSSVVEALDNLSRNYDSLILRRFVTGMVLAIERGSSLTPILIAQVKDARVARKNQILQRAGRAEIALMIPVVFLILPISILFALWPSYQQLGTFV